MIILVAAASDNNVIGKDNTLIWHLPNDLKRFKSLTLNSCIIMGRKTFESLPGILPKRTHIVISANKNYKPEGVIVVKSLEDALSKVPPQEDAFIVGGGQIYKQAIAIADKIELTRVHHQFDGDTYFPEIDTQLWDLVESDFYSSDEKHPYSYTFETYVKTHS